MRKWMGIACALLALAGCGGDEGGVGSTPTGEAQGQPAGQAVADLSTPRGSISYQLALLHANDVEAFRECFTERLRSRVKEDQVAEASKEAAEMTLDDLFASVEEGEYEGKSTAKVTMKNGRTLTTLILTDGKWLSDTLWYR